MPRIRTIKPEFFTDDDIAQMTPLARLAFEGLWCHADKAGRLEDRPARLKVLILPYDAVDFEVVLAELSARRFIQRYRADDGRAYIQIRTFEKHQRPRSDEDESKIPAPQEVTGADTAPRLQSDAVVTPQTLGKERKGEGERNGREGGSTRLPARQGSGVMAGALPRDHIRHAWCSARLCVPDFIHGQLHRQLGGDPAAGERWLRETWYPAVIARCRDAPIGERPEKFWPAQFAAEFPPTDVGKGRLTLALERATAAFLQGFDS